VLQEIGSLVTPDTLLRWHRQLIAKKYDRRWMEQVARNATDGRSGFLLGKEYLIIDRDSRFTKEFRGILHTAGVNVIRTPRARPI
jgi:hypothetical protein